MVHSRLIRIATSPEDWPNLIHTDEALQIATQLDQESIVLLENPGRVLPLGESVQRIAVIGPFADVVNYGDYTVSPPPGVSPLEGIRRAAPPGVQVYHAKGCDAWSNDESQIAEALRLARSSDVVVVIVGTWARSLLDQQKDLNATTGEVYDTNDLQLVGAQSTLLRQLIRTGVKTVVVFSSGKPITESWISQTNAALLQQFYTSENGGQALGEVLFGHSNPSGRLPLTFPRDTGSLPVTYDYLKSGRDANSPGHIEVNGSIHFGRSYVTATPVPWYELGYGRSYSEFEYSDIEVDRTHVRATDTVKVTVQVKNVSSRDGWEVAQLYIVDPISSVVIPNKQLKAFHKVFVKAGESVKMAFDIDVRTLGLWNAEMRYVVEPGEFIAHVARTAGDIRGNVTFTVV